MRFSYNSFIVIILLFSFFSCKSDSPKKILIEFKGLTMGSGYSLSYHDSLNRNLQSQIDSLLDVYNQELSTYSDASRLSAFNNSDTGIFIPDSAPQHLTRNFEIALRLYKITQGWFNPALMPLVNYWGFGKGNKKGVENPDTNLIDSLLKLCDFKSISVDTHPNGTYIKKNNPETKIIFNAMAPGDAADQIGLFLETMGIKHYLVEVGGEIRCRGKQSKDYGWIVGINTPKEGAAINDMQVIVELKDISLATSGNYRSIIEVKGKKYAHTLNPINGFPEKNSLLSASIFTKDCADADALATACMAMGLEKSWQLVNSLDGVEGYFIYAAENGEMMVKYSPNLENWIKK